MNRNMRQHNRPRQQKKIYLKPGEDLTPVNNRGPEMCSCCYVETLKPNKHGLPIEEVSESYLKNFIGCDDRRLCNAEKGVTAPHYCQMLIRVHGKNEKAHCKANECPKALAAVAEYTGKYELVKRIGYAIFEVGLFFGLDELEVKKKYDDMFDECDWMNIKSSLDYPDTNGRACMVSAMGCHFSECYIAMKNVANELGETELAERIGNAMKKRHAHWVRTSVDCDQRDRLRAEEQAEEIRMAEEEDAKW